MAELSEQVLQGAEKAGHLGIDATGAGVAMLGDHLTRQLEQGPAGIRVLACWGGFASIFVSIASVTRPVSAMSAPVTFLVSLYQVAFAVITVLFEMPLDWIEKVEQVNQAHEWLLHKAQFLGDVLGRGLFYVFVGALWLVLASMQRLLILLAGQYMVLIGVLHLFMYFGIMPKTVASKMRAGYSQVAQSEPA